MGWYRYQTLSIDHASDDELRAIYRALKDHDDARYIFDVPHEEPNLDQLTWYGCANERNPPSLVEFFGELSRRFPAVLFTVEWYDDRPEEEAGRVYYRNGRKQEVFAEVSYPAFDPTRAEPIESASQGSLSVGGPTPGGRLCPRGGKSWPSS
ncbi:MAG: hypothetical protein AB1411_02425 [Nitrospirota bacterium]